MKSELEFENITKRFDSEYLQKHYLKNIKTLKNYIHGFHKLKLDIEHLSGGATPLGAEYSAEGIPFLRVQNIMQNYFNLNDVVYLNKKQDEEIKRSRLKEGDVLLTITGVSYGKSAVISKELENANINQHSVKISLNKNLNPYFLSTFLNCKYGKLQSDKNIVGVTRPALDYEVIRNFNIPNVNIQFQNQVENLIINTQNITKQSENLYSQAENLLLQEIGLQNFKPSKEAVNIKSFKESFDRTKRLDAEYYQKKYEEILMYIKSNCKYEKLESLTTFINNGNQPPYSENGEIIFFSQKWINDKSIDYSFLNSKDEPRVSKSFFDDKKNKPYLIQKHDILYYSVGANLGYCHNYLLDEPIAIGSFINLIRPNSNRVNPLYLGIVLNSLIGRLQSEKEKSGMAQPYIYAKSLREFIIPIIDFKKQEQIADLISESFKLKTESERLLEVAKKAVEIAIETDEQTATKFIKDNEI